MWTGLPSQVCTLCVGWRLEGSHSRPTVVLPKSTRFTPVVTFCQLAKTYPISTGPWRLLHVVNGDSLY